MLTSVSTLGRFLVEALVVNPAHLEPDTPRPLWIFAIGVDFVRVRPMVWRKELGISVVQKVMVGELEPALNLKAVSDPIVGVARVKLVLAVERVVRLHSEELQRVYELAHKSEPGGVLVLHGHVQHG